MKTNHTAIKLDATFVRLVTGAAKLSDIISERNTARATRMASEDAYTRRHRERSELSDPFAMNYCR
jgi:hypothetical protein